MVTKLQSVFYFAYKATSSSTYFIFSRMTPLGVMMMILLPLVVVIFLTYFKLASLYLLSMVVGMLVFSLMMLWLRRGEVKVIQRRIPRYATVGKELSYQVQYRNLKSKELHSYLLHDKAPDSRPTQVEFVTSREPLEANRNIFDRVFAYYRWMWLCDQKMKFESEAVLLPLLKSQEENTVSLTCTPLRRGRLLFKNMRLFMPEPLGLLQRSQKVDTPEDAVIVLPKRYKLPDLVLDGAARDHSGGRSYSSMSGMSDDFKGLRAYRSGDSLKHIDWAAWARTGNPVIREYENVFFPRYALVLDTNGAYETSEKFEEAISIAASFAQVVDTQECLIDLMFLNKGLHTITVGKAVEKSENVLETLATLEIELEPDWDSLAQQVLKHAASFSACIIIFNQLSDERIDLVKKWRKVGINVLILVIVDGADSEVKSAVLELGAIPIRMGSVQQDLLKM